MKFTFFHIVKEGQSAGRILAYFQLIKLEKNEEKAPENNIEKSVPIFSPEHFV